MSNKINNQFVINLHNFFLIDDLHNWRRRLFKKALEKVEIRHIRIHDLRHTYTAIRISKGHDIVDVSNHL